MVSRLGPRGTGFISSLLQHSTSTSAGWAGSDLGLMGEGLADKRPGCHFSASPSIAHKDTVSRADSTKVHIKGGKLSYCVATETRTLLNSSLHYRLFSQGKLKTKKPLKTTKKTTHGSRPYYKSKHWCGISEERRKLLRTKPKSPHRGCNSSQCPYLSTLTHHLRPLILEFSEVKRGRRNRNRNGGKESPKTQRSQDVLEKSP